MFVDCFSVNLHKRLQPCHMIMGMLHGGEGAELGFQRQNCNKAQLHSFPSAVAFKTCWSEPLGYYRVRKSNCSVQLHFSWIFKSFNAQRRQPWPENPPIDNSCSMWTFTRHFRTSFTYIQFWFRRGSKDHTRFIGISPGEVFNLWLINHLSYVVNVEACMS